MLTTLSGNIDDPWHSRNETATKEAPALRARTSFQVQLWELPERALSFLVFFVVLFEKNFFFLNHRLINR